MKKVILSLLVASSMFAFGCSGSEGGGNTIQTTLERPSINVPFKVSSLVTTGLTTFAIATDGKLYAWGYNINGLVGNGRSGSGEYQTTPYEVTSVGKVKSIETDGSTVYSITEDNRLYAWGYNYYGQVGNGESDYNLKQLTPYEVTQVGKVKSVVTTSNTAYAITEDNRLYAWGYNGGGLVGNGSTTTQKTPYELTSVGKVKSLKISGSTVYAITEDNRLYAWGSNGSGKVGNGSTGTQKTPYEVTSIVGKVKSVISISSTVYAITEEGKLYAWGDNEYGQVGNGSSGYDAYQTTPYEVTSIVGKVKSLEIDSYYTAYAITEEGRLYAWGINNYGEVGNGSTSDQTTPYELTSIVGKVKSVVTNNNDTVYAITEDGRLYALGDNSSGEVGNGSTGTQTTPYELTSVSKVKSVVTNGDTVYAITEEGRLYAWGGNYSGEVGNGSTGTQTIPYGVTSIVGKVKSVVCSDFIGSTVYAITEDNKLYAWGYNTYGEVGNGSTSDQTTPYEVTSIVGKVKSLEIDGYHTVYAITEDNRLYAWGDNGYGEVGNGSYGDQTTPYYISEVKQFLE